MKHRICAESQGDGVPCMSVRVACDECARARPLPRKRVRRKAGAKPSPQAAAVEPDASAPEPPSE